MSKAIFYDARGKRRRWSFRTLFAGLGVLVVAAVVFAVTILDVPAGDPLPIRYERAQPLPLGDQVRLIRHKIDHSLRTIGWLPPRSKTAVRPGQTLTVGFYVPWDDTSRASLQAHVGQLDWVVPATLSIAGPQHALVQTPDPRFDAIIAHAARRPAVLPMVQNIADGIWDGAGAAAMMRDPAARRVLIDRLSATLTARHAAGVVFDFENLSKDVLPAYRQFLREARATFAPRRLQVALTVPAGDADWDLRAFAGVADRLFLMDYDEHWQGGTAGPIASQPWFIRQLRDAITTVGRDKLIVALGSYAYDWHGGTVDALTVEEAWLAAHDAGAPLQFDSASGNIHFAYTDGGVEHQVWMVDAAAIWNQLRATRALGVGAVALWRLGSEDPGVWTDFATWQTDGLPDLAVVRPMTDVDVEGNGEILRIASVPRPGRRVVTADQNRLIRDEQYTVLPTPYVVQRTGDLAKQVALTFDDGPDADWTPKLLDVMKARQVVGTFFIVGENGLAHPLLLRRIVAEGSEIGNHSYTHPNMALDTPRGIAVELNATQRLIEAYTGRATRLFRAPYFGDAEPTTADEIGPALEAQRHGYTVVGLHVDPNDWQRPASTRSSPKC